MYVKFYVNRPADDYGTKITCMYEINVEVKPLKIDVFSCFHPSALDITPTDTKALFRKCQALESLGQHQEAFAEARKLSQLEPNNTAVQGMLRRIGELLNEKV